MSCGLNHKRLGLTFILVFITIWVTDFLVHAVWLSARYKETAPLWRPEGEMIPAALFGGQFIVASLFSIIFAKGYEGKCWMEGVRFGILFGILMAGQTLIQFAVTPLPVDITLSWIGAGVAQSILCGLVASKAYKGPFAHTH